MDCEEVRGHLESCEECRLHVVVEARLRSQPVLEPPPGLVGRVMKSLPRRAPLWRESLRLAAAAAFLLALAAAASGLGLQDHEKVNEMKTVLAQPMNAAGAAWDLMEETLWTR